MPNAILAFKNFQNQVHNFSRHAKFIIIDKLVNIKQSKATLRHRLIKRKKVWIEKVERLHSQGLSQTNKTSR